MLQANLALPVAGVALSVAVVAAPDSVCGTAALQRLPPVSQLSVWAVQAATQEAWVGALQVPSLQEKVAPPVAGAVPSVRLAESPEAAPGADAEQLLAPTCQLSVWAPHARGAAVVQLALVAAPQLPSLQAKRALPVVGSVASSASALPPDAVAETAAEQLLAPTLQLMVWAPQLAGSGRLQLALPGALQLPLLQLKLAVPVAGSTASLTTVCVPEGEAATDAEQLLPPTFQLRDWATQAAGGAVQLAFVAAPQLPLVQAKVALPVAGSTPSVAVADRPDAVAPRLAEQLLAPTLQLIDRAAHGGETRLSNAACICAALRPRSKMMWMGCEARYLGWPFACAGDQSSSVNM